MVKGNYRNVTISGKIATGTTTLAKNLQQLLMWEYINTGSIQREWDRKHGINEHGQGAEQRPDEHEQEMETMAHKILTEREHVIYEAWLSGFIARNIQGVFKVLLICTDDAIRVDRVVNRNGITVEQAKKFIRIREEENIVKWKKIYGDHNFWDPAKFDLVIDTYSSGRMETLGKVLDKLGYLHQ